MKLKPKAVVYKCVSVMCIVYKLAVIIVAAFSFFCVAYVIKTHSWSARQ